MPNQPKTPIRSIRVPDDLWYAVQAKVAAEDTNATALIVAFLKAYLSSE